MKDTNHIRSVWAKNQADKRKREREAGLIRLTVTIPAESKQELLEFVKKLNE